MEQDLSLEGPGAWSHEGERFLALPAFGVDTGQPIPSDVQ
jgi:hypothetical protein